MQPGRLFSGETGGRGQAVEGATCPVNISGLPLSAAAAHYLDQVLALVDRLRC